MTELRAITIEIPTAVAQKLTEWHEGTLEHATTLALKLYSGIGKEGYTALQSLAHASDTTTAKALREAIFHAQRTLNAPATPPTVGRPKINTERDNAIYAAVTQQGKTYSQAATLFNLSLVRVGQIIAQQRAERGETGRQFKAPKQEVVPVPKPEPRPETPEEAQARAKRKAADAISNAMMDMLNGTQAATAAKKYELDVERTRAAYAAYSAVVSAGSTKAEKATAIFTAFTAYDEYGMEPKVLSLKEPTEAPDTPAKPRYVMPALEALKAQQANQPPADTRTAKERDVFNPEFGF
jgi:hypothetical protein